MFKAPPVTTLEVSMCFQLLPAELLMLLTDTLTSQKNNIFCHVQNGYINDIGMFRVFCDVFADKENTLLCVKSFYTALQSIQRRILCRGKNNNKPSTMDVCREQYCNLHNKLCVKKTKTSVWLPKNHKNNEMWSIFLQCIMLGQSGPNGCQATNSLQADLNVPHISGYVTFISHYNH